jgi:uncharacterized protein (TIGR03435 family)
MLMGAPAAWGQTFEVASIRRCETAADAALNRGGPGGRAGGAEMSSGRIDIKCQTVEGLIQLAYNLALETGRMPLLEPMEGGAGWTRSERFTISAKAETSVGQDAMKGPMLRALLEDRFQLKVRRESRDVPVYALTVARGGAKLRPHEEGSCVGLDPSMKGPPTKPFCGTTNSIRKGGSVTIQFRAISFRDFARNLGVNGGPQLLDRPVVDKTGITGTYDIDLHFAPDYSNPGFQKDVVSDPSGPSIFTAVQEQLGLKLEPAKGPVEYLVIERVERPTEN